MMTRLVQSCALALSLLALSAALLPAEETPTTATLGRHPQIEVQGCQALTADGVRRALKNEVKFHAALLSQSPLETVERQIAEIVEAGYRELGFPHAKVIVKAVLGETDNPFEQAPGKLVIEIQEGRLYPAGSIGVQGAVHIDAERLVAELQPLDEGLAKRAELARRSDAGTIEKADLPYWESGDVVSFNPQAVQPFADRMVRLFKDQGFRWVRFSVQIIPDDVTQTATLKIDIEDEGPKAILGKIEITGNVRNSTQDIIDYIKVEPGAVLTSDLWSRVWWDLMHSGRFYRHNVKVADQPVDDTGVVPLLISLEEADQVPLLREELTEEQLVLLKFARWQQRLGKSNIAYRIQVSDYDLSGEFKPISSDLKNAELELDFDAVVAPNEALYLSWSLRRRHDANVGKSGRILLDRNQIDCVFPIEKARVQLPISRLMMNSTWQIILTHILGPDRDKSGKMSGQVTMGLRISSWRKQENPIQFDSQVYPVSLLQMATRAGRDCRFEADELVVRIEDDEYRIDRESGQLNSFTRQPFDGFGMAVSIKKDPDALSRVRKTLDEDSRDFQTWAGDQAPISTAIALLCNHGLFQAHAHFSDGQVKALRWLESIIQEVIAERSIDHPLPQLSNSHRLSPPNWTSHGVVEGIPWKVTGRQAGIFLLMLSNNVLPEESSLAEINCLAAVCANRNETDWLSSFEMSTTSNQGPLAYLEAASLLASIKPNASFQLANKGLKNLASGKFTSEIESLVQEDSFVGQVLLKAMRRFKNLSHDELSQLVKEFELDEYTQQIKSTHQLFKESSDDLSREITIICLSGIWDTVRPYLQKRLEGLADPRPEPVRRLQLTTSDKDSFEVKLIRSLRTLQQTNNAEIHQAFDKVEDSDGPEKLREAGVEDFSPKTLAEQIDKLQLSAFDSPQLNVPLISSASHGSKAVRDRDGVPVKFGGIDISSMHGEPIENDQVIAIVDGCPIVAEQALLTLMNQYWLTSVDVGLRQHRPAPSIEPIVRNHLRYRAISRRLPRLIDEVLVLNDCQKALSKSQMESVEENAECLVAESLRRMMLAAEVDSLDQLDVLYGPFGFNLKSFQASYSQTQRASGARVYKCSQEFNPSREEMEAYYQEHQDDFDDFREGRKVRWRQFTVPIEKNGGRDVARQLADTLLEQVQKDDSLFGPAQGDGKSTKAMEGKLWDWTEPGSLESQAVETALFSIPIRWFSRVIETETDFQFVQVLERNEGTVPPFERVAQRVKLAMARNTFPERHKQYVDRLRKAAKIEIKIPLEKETASESE